MKRACSLVLICVACCGLTISATGQSQPDLLLQSTAPGRISFTGQAGRLYEIQYGTLGASPSPWLHLTNLVLPASGSQFLFTDPGSNAAAARIYRAAQYVHGDFPLPPMGVTTYFPYGRYGTEAQIVTFADSLRTNHLQELGYRWIIVDTEWTGGRDADGHLYADTNRFPHGIQWLINYCHDTGFKVGLYYVVGHQSEGTPGSYGYWQLDAADAALWGADLLRLSCDDESFWDTTPPTIYDRYQLFLNGLASVGKPVFVEATVHHFLPWMPSALNAWQYVGTSTNFPNDIPDAHGSWTQLVDMIDAMGGTASAVRPGSYILPDWIPLPGTLTEFQSQFGLRALLSGLLILPTATPAALTLDDPFLLGYKYVSVIANPDVIAIDQDPGCWPPQSVLTNGAVHVWCKSLGTLNGKSKAVGFWNRDPNFSAPPVNVAVTWEQLGLPAGPATVYDCWQQASLGSFTNAFTTNVVSRGLQLYRITSN